MKKLLAFFLTILLVAIAIKVDSKENFSKMTNSQLITELMNIDSETVRIQALAAFDGFIAEDNFEPEFRGGVI